MVILVGQLSLDSSSMHCVYRLKQSQTVAFDTRGTDFSIHVRLWFAVICCAKIWTAAQKHAAFNEYTTSGFTCLCQLWTMS